MSALRRLAALAPLLAGLVIVGGSGCGKVIGLEDEYKDTGSGSPCTAEIGEKCKTSGDCCDFPAARCAEFLNAKQMSLGQVCTPTCKSNDDCDSGCCIPYEGGTKVCAFRYYCGEEPGSVCQVNDDCKTQCCPSNQLLCALPSECP